MRRIPRLGRPSGLPSATTNVSRATASHFTTTTQYPPSSQRQRQRPTATRFYPPSLNRFYSSDKQQTPAPAPTQAQAPESAPEPAPVQEQSQELQPETRVADEIIPAEAAEEDLNWAADEEGFTAEEGPYVAPPQRAEAPREDEVADSTYFPATTAQGLKKVGGLADWWYRPDNWDVTGDFTSFRPREKVVDPVLIEAAVRRAVVEALALHQVGRRDELVAVWPTAGDLRGLLARDVKSEDGRVTLGGDPEAIAEGLRWKHEEDGSVPLPEALTAKEISALSQTWDPSWKTISLKDPRIRFAVTKRLFQLTGHLVPDYQLPSITTMQALLRILKKPPKPATLTEEIQKRHPDLLELPNVTVAAKRVTRGDKEKALGRFKIMQEEFKKRDIPGLGHGYARKGREIQRLRGDA
ncbi:ribosomal subunit 39S-domain-containing protein [Xylaria curta]|nr:ribosomal subunit 39S-domain-containing protein [Xylaria curta]